MSVFRPGNIMILPTAACQASCAYCFARKTGGVMDDAVADAALDFTARIVPEGRDFHLTFHGGEPLLAGERFFERMLPALRERFGRRVRLSVQSNLWEVTDGLAELFARYRVSVGTSVDGPRDMCDSQRGNGYYDRTKAGEAVLLRHGIRAGEICTFAAGNEGRAAEVYRRSAQPYSIHGAVPAPGAPDAGGCLTCGQMKRVLLDSYEAYRADPARSRITTVDSMARGCLIGRGCLCTFFDCLGAFAAIAPDGGVYSCQRFCGDERFRLGNVTEGLTEEQILKSPAYAALTSARDAATAACGDCEHREYCMGGCPYNALTAGTEKDPYCEAYRAVFERVRTDMAVEMGEVMLGRAVSTPVLAMAGDRPHPWDARRNRERMRESLERGRGPEPWPETQAGPWPGDELNKLYLHVTFDCPLRCPHCYAEGGERKTVPMPPERFAEIVREAAGRMFRETVITGGEPLTWPGFDALCRELRGLDRKGMKLALRSSFGFEIPPERLKTAAELFDEIAVSVDGGREEHDARRGAGRYDLTVKNLERAAAAGANLSLAATMGLEACGGAPGDSVRALAKRLNIEKIRFRPVLPLGRAAEAGGEPWQLCGEETELNRPFRPRASCGLGRNLYVEPDGTAYPCYAWCAPDKKLGDLSRETLGELLDRGELYGYQSRGVDTNEKCRICEVRYLCGGMCRAWAKDRENPDSGDFDCTSRRNYYTRLARRLGEEDARTDGAAPAPPPERSERTGGGAFFCPGHMPASSADRADEGKARKEKEMTGALSK